MPDYTTPGVYAEDINSVVNMPTGTDPVAAFLGVAATGPVGTPTLIDSWNAYLTTFATGQDSAFLTNSYLAHAVYGFFQNGGKKCYVTRVTKGTVSSAGEVSYAAAKSANAAVSADSATVLAAGVFTAKSEGAWGNNITIEIPASGVDTTLNIFTLKVKYNGTVVESWGNLKPTSNTAGCFADVLNAGSNYISVANLSATLNLTALSGKTITFTGGSDTYEGSGAPVQNEVYIAALSKLDFIDEIRLVAIPGADNNLQVAVASYCTNFVYRIAICEGLETDNDSAISTLRGNLNGMNAALYSPWIKVTNPLSSNGALIAIPACGHICGIYSRISNTRGFWKAPAGTEANIRGAVDVVTIYSQTQTDVLNPKGINAIVPKTNYGIVVWGARSCSGDLPYISDLYTNITIKKNLYDLTQPLVFEPHDSKLWSKMTTICQTYLNDLFQRGAFVGDTAADAYLVKCDEELNPPSVRNAGKLIAEVGYAGKKPAEFIIIRISHDLTNA